MSELCVLCRAKPLVASTETQTRVCTECAQITGVVPLPPSTRPQLPCMRCQHTALIRVVPRELTASGGDYVQTVAAPMYVTYAVQSQKRTFFAGSTVETPAAGQGYGILEAWICEACGFVEWYCQRPTEIPVGAAFNSERHVVPSPGFRG
jgi:hypothetical protein